MGLQQALFGNRRGKFTRLGRVSGSSWKSPGEIHEVPGGSLGVLREFMGVSGRIWTVVYFFAKMVVLRGRCLIFGPPEPTSRGSPGAPPGVHGFSPGGFRPYSILAAKGCQDVPEMMISRKLSVLFDARCALCIIDATFQAPRLDTVKRHKWFSKRYASGSLFTGRCF